jgi:putative tricarboxylic transport membrane protein
LNNIAAGSVSLLVSLIYTIFAFQIPPSSYKSAQVEPDLFPIIIGSLWILASLVLLIRGGIQNRTVTVKGINGTEKASEENDQEIDDDNLLKQDRGKLIVILLLILVYIILFIPLGYIISTAIFIASLTMYLERKQWIRNLIYAILFPVIVYLVFNYLLAVNLPM